LGYWSNRVGKVLNAGGVLLQQYAPGMENFLPLEVMYFSSPQEAVENIKHLLDRDRWRLHQCALSGVKFTSIHKVSKLTTLIERFLKEDNGKNWRI
jgi:spore maturation protein CgeB